MEIKRFTLNHHQKKLIIAFSDDQIFELSFEYLRVLSPQKSKKNTIEAHQKQVQLILIENVGKHGFRFIFDDQHSANQQGATQQSANQHSAIYSSEYLTLLCQEYKQRWQQYLHELQALGHSREAMINITQL